MGIKIPGKRYGKRLSTSKVFGGGGVGGQKPSNSDLNMTPLVDMFVIMVLFLIANFSATGEVLMMTNEIQLPEAKHVQEAMALDVIQVSADAVLIDGEIISRVADVTREEYLNIPALEEKLRDMRKAWENLHAATKEEFKGEIMIQGHKEVPFSVLKRVMYSAATAGYGNINFAVLNTGGDPALAAAAAAH